VKHIPGPDGRDLSVLAIGCVGFTPDAQDRTDEMLDAWVENGGNIIDTAWVYGGGEATTSVGNWLQKRGVAEQVCIYTKICHPWGEPRFGPEFFLEDLAAERERLQVECIDVVGFHRDGPEVPISEMMSAVVSAYEAGHFKALAASNWTIERVAAWNAYAEVHGGVPFAFNNPNLSLATVNEPMWGGCLTAGDEERSWHASTGLPLWSWSATGGGFFAEVDNDDVRRVYHNEENFRRLERARELGSKRGLKPVQVALLWTLHQPFPTRAIVGPQTVGQIAELATVASESLSVEEVRWLETGE